MNPCNCPICDKENVNHLNNHVRMSAGNGHGPQGTYPEGWNKTDGELEHAADDVDEADAVDDAADLEAADLEGDVDDDAADLEGDDLEGDDLEGDDAGDPDELLDDDPADASTYNCGNCGHELDYLGGDDREEGGKQCPECGERLFWSMVEA